MSDPSEDADRHEPEQLPELSFAGIKTFLKAEQSHPSDLTDDVDVGVIGVPFDGAVSREPGARHGPEALREASAWYAYLAGYKGEIVNLATDRAVDYEDMRLVDCGDAPTVPNDIGRTREQVQHYVRSVANHAFPLVLGGDHYITYPAFAGFAASVDERVGLIHLDAHTDTVESSTLYGEHFHGSPMARINDLEHGGYDKHAMIGIRAYEGPGFQDLIDDDGLQVDYADDVREKGIEACIEDAIAHATDGVDHVYLTVDIDSVDPAYAPGTGTPEPAGLTSADLLTAMDMLGEVDEIGAMDLMEVAPKLDPAETTARLGANALVRFLESKFL